MSHTPQPPPPPLPPPPLPVGWAQLVDAHGQPYFYNETTRQSQWHAPLPSPPSQLPPPPPPTPPPPVPIEPTLLPVTHHNPLHGAAPSNYRGGGPPATAEQSPRNMSSPGSTLQSPASLSDNIHGGFAGSYQANPASVSGATLQSPASCVFSHFPAADNAVHVQPPPSAPEYAQNAAVIQGGQARMLPSHFSRLPAPIFS